MRIRRPQSCPLSSRGLLRWGTYPLFQVGLSIDGDEEAGTGEGIDLGLRYAHHHALQTGASTPSPEIILAFGSTSTGTVPGSGTVQQGRGAAAFNLPGGSGSSHGVGSGHGLSIHGFSGHGPFSGRDGSSRHSVGSGMPRVLSWPGVSSSDGGLGDGSNTDDEDDVGVCDPDGATIAGDMEAGILGSPSREPPSCYICVERRPDAVVMECGHGGMCFKCAQQLASTPPAQCPVCRKPIQQVLRFERIVTVRSGGSVVGGGGAGGGSAGGTGSAGGGSSRIGSGGKEPNTCSAEELVGSGGDIPVVAIAASSSSVGIGSGPPAAGGASGARATSGSFVRRFSAPDEPGVPAMVGARVSGGGGGGGGGAGSVPAGDDSNRTASPLAPRETSRRRGGSDAGVAAMSLEEGWLDPV